MAHQLPQLVGCLASQSAVGSAISKVVELAHGSVIELEAGWVQWLVPWKASAWVHLWARGKESA